MTSAPVRAEPGRVSGSVTVAERRRIVMLCDVDFSYPDATRTHTVEVAKGFVRAGHAVDLVARGPDPALSGVSYSPAVALEDERVRRLITVNARTIRLLWQRRRESGLFYVRDSWSCFPATAVARLLGYRVVSQVDGIPYGGADIEERSRLSAALKRYVAIAMGRLSHGVLAVTPEIRELLIRVALVPPERIAVVPNGVDLDFFAPQDRRTAARRVGLDPDLRYVVFCGGFHPWTNFDALVEAVAILAAGHVDVRLVLVGDGVERARIERRSAELHVSRLVTVTGMLADRHQVRDYLAAAMVTVLAYRSDEVGRTSASPIKLAEYMASGRAVVAVAIPGIREYLEETGAGIVVDDSAEALAEAIGQTLDPARADRLGAAGRAYAEARLSWDRVIADTLPLFGPPDVRTGAGRRTR